MTRHDPDDLIETVEGEKATIREQYLPALEWFLERPGLAPRTEVVSDLAADLDVERDVAGAVVGHLVSDDVDPVQQVVRPTEGKYVGVISYAEHEWFYSFDRYDDVAGRETRAVCAHCIHEAVHAADAAHFTRSPEEYDADLARVALALHYHVDHAGTPLAEVIEGVLGVDSAAFADRNGLGDPSVLSLRDVTRRLDTDPELQGAVAGATLSVPEVDVKPGASLATGTTIAGNTSWHAGNDGTGSNLDANTLQNKTPADLWRLVERDPYGNAYIQNTTSTYAGSIYAQYGSNTGSYYYTDTTLTPTNSWDAGFLSYTVRGAYSYTNLTISTLNRNGSTVSPEREGAIATGITTGDTFYFRFHNTDRQKGSIYAQLKGAKLV